MTKLNDRQRLFAQHLVSGMPAGRAYEKAGYETTGNTSEAEASRLLRNPKLATYIEELRRKSDDAIEYARAQLLDFHVRVLQAKPEDAGPQSDISEVRMSKQGPYFAVIDKHKSSDALRKMLGWDKPEKVEVGATDALAELLSEIRGRK